MRPRGVPTRRGEPQFDEVCGGGQRTFAQPDLADLEPRVAVQPVDPLDAVHRAGGDHVQRAAGHDLLGGLEDQPHAARQLRRARQRPRRAQQDRGVRVVPAHVRGAFGLGGVREAGGLGQRQGVHVGAQGDAAVPAADVADDAGARGQHPRLEPDRAEQGHDHFGRDELVAGELRMRVDVPAPREHVGGVRAEPVVEPEGAASGTKVMHRCHADAGLGDQRGGRLYRGNDATLGVAWNVRT